MDDVGQNLLIQNPPPKEPQQIHRGPQILKISGNINCLMYMDDIKLFAKNEKKDWKSLYK